MSACLDYSTRTIKIYSGAYDVGLRADFAEHLADTAAHTAPALIAAPASGATIVMAVPQPLYVNNAVTLAALTIRLPSPSAVTSGTRIALGFRSPVTVLGVQDSAGVAVEGGPVNAYGPGAAIEFLYIGTGWVPWK